MAKRIDWLMVCVFIIFCFSSNLFSWNHEPDTAAVEGFVSGTLIKTPSGYSPIETISVGDVVMSCDFEGDCVERQVLSVGSAHADRYMKLWIDGAKIEMGFSTKFFSKDSWVNATGLFQMPTLMDARYQFVLVEQVENVEEEVMLYNLSVEQSHNYFVSSADILVHNCSQEEFEQASKKDRARVLIMEQFQKQGFTNPMQLSYILATAEHETDNFRTMKEYGGENKSYAPWYGRGYSQLTHNYNYLTYKKFLNMDIVSDPDLMLREDVSAAVIVDGMMYGEFTGKKLIKYINNGRCDFFEARRTVNGLKHADRVAALAKRWAQYFRDIKNSQYAGLLTWLVMPANHQSCSLVNGPTGDL